MSIADEIFRVEGLQVNDGQAAHFGKTPDESMQDAERRFLIAAVIATVPNYGPELVVNGSFDTDTDWTKGTGWTIADGFAVGAAGSAAPLTQGPADLVVALLYRVIFTVISISAGGVGPNVGSTLGTLRTAVGSYTEEIVAGASSAIVMDKDAAFVGSIDNVSVREVLEGNPTNQDLWIQFNVEQAFTTSQDIGEIKLAYWKTK